MEKGNSKIGGWAFIIGLVLAVLVALFSSAQPPQWAIFVLALLGLLVGFLNVTDKETQTFLVAAVAFLLSFQSLSMILARLAFGWTAVGVFFDLVSVFIAPAAAIVAVKAIFGITKE